MISDFEILGIQETSDLGTIKSAFRNRVKALHPDLVSGRGAIENHNLFISVCEAYEHLIQKADKLTDTASPTARGSSQGHDALQPHRDSAYVFYKQGMKAFMAIHPSAWGIDLSEPSESSSHEYAKDGEDSRKKVMELMKLFPKAYYYFGIVVHEYPQSDWAFDAMAKMGKIDESLKRYQKIIESFDNWESARNEKSTKHNGLYQQMNERQKEIRKHPPKGWGK